MDAVKLEGGRDRVNDVQAIISAGIPVMGHLGLTPQSVHKFGGFRAQGKSASAARKLVEDARALQGAGCFSIVLEAVPEKLATYISTQLEIPTIGIGAGVGCDGQVLVTHDLIGLFDRFTPKFVKQYASIHADMARAFSKYRTDVEYRVFPAEEHAIAMHDDEWEAFLKEMDE
jgi:3-methyl-2-oxobutanoate hydroxymethyltransferase